MEAALATWRSKWRHFERGVAWQEVRAVYHPVLDEQGAFVGFVQGMDGTCGVPESHELSGYVKTRLRVLARALAHAQPDEKEDALMPRATAVVTVLASSDSAETERAKTVAALVRSEWNATRAARLAWHRSPIGVSADAAHDHRAPGTVALRSAPAEGAQLAGLRRRPAGTST